VYDDDDDDDENDVKRQRKKQNGNKTNKNDAGVSLDTMKYSILGRKVVTSVEGTLEDELNYLKRKFDGEKKDNDILASSPSPTTLENLQKDLMCPICHEVLLEPLSLSCGHSFCQDCLSWWASSPTYQSTLEQQQQQQDKTNPKCPTCRTPITNQGGFSSLRVNMCLRACVMAHFAKDLQDRLDLKARATSGENGGRHSLGYVIVTPLEEYGLRIPVRMETNRSSRKSDGVSVIVSRTVAMDSDDQCMRLALAVYGPIIGRPDEKECTTTFRISLCLLHIHEDEAEEGIPFLVGRQTDEEHLISQVTQLSSHVDLSRMGANEQMRPLGRRKLRCDGTLDLSVSFESRKDETTIMLHHGVTGLHLLLEIFKNGTPRCSNAMSNNNNVSTNLGTAGNGLVENLNVEEQSGGSGCGDDDDDDSSDDNEFVYGVGLSDTGEYENDGFVVHDADDDDDAMSHDECCLCGNGGELLVCDGGDHGTGCRKGFHVACVGLDAVPEGDWICSACAEGLGHETRGIMGYEYPSNTETFRVQEDDDDDGEKSDDSEHEFDMKGETEDNETNHDDTKTGKRQSRRESPEQSRPSKRRLVIESEEEDE